jgi:hypothetical protein
MTTPSYPTSTIPRPEVQVMDERKSMWTREGLRRTSDSTRGFHKKFHHIRFRHCRRTVGRIVGSESAVSNSCRRAEDTPLVMRLCKSDPLFLMLVSILKMSTALLLEWMQALCACE